MAEEQEQNYSEVRSANQHPSRMKRPVRKGAGPASAEMVAMDGSDLLRPQRFKGVQWVVVAVVMLVAAIIGYNVYSLFMDNFIYANERQQEAVNTQLARNVSLDLPAANLFVGYDDDTILANINAQGYICFVNELADGTSLEIVKLPSDLTLEQGQTLYKQGISKLQASDAAKILNGMWRLDVTHNSGTSIRIAYADFKSGSAEAALTSAMTTQGLTEDSVTDSGTDDSGNTYKTGTCLVNGITATWRISSIALSEIYSISQLPSTSMYVGIRYTY